ncbi:MAG TPA: hypothetical protein VF868_08465 [Bacteroidia bacterium]|jgi:hypothetical protein
MIRTITILLVVILPVLDSYAQKPKEKASAQIHMLKDGALLIKLKTSENVINGLIKDGKPEEAEKVREEQLIRNKEIAQAFTETISFCKVYFFYSSNSAAVKSGDLGSIMNGSLEADSTFNTVNYLIGEFGESPHNNIEGFIIEDRNLEQLQPPFPSFIRSNKAGLKTRSYKEIAEILDTELNEFYNKSK